MALDRGDIARFAFYFAFFSVLFAGFDVVSGPSGQDAYDSASRETASSAATPRIESRTVSPLELSRVEFHPVVEAPPVSPSSSASTEVRTPSEAAASSEASPSVTKPVESIEVAPAGAKVPPQLLKGLRSSLDSPKWNALIHPVTLVLDAARTDPRGQNVGRKVTMSLGIKDRNEAVKVLVHELAHVIDVQYFQKNAFGFDRSETFYGISWKTATVKADGAAVADFVSGYALTNRYEDFAESFAFYVFHNEDFRARANTNDALRKKYAFFERYVFPDGTFSRTDFGLQDAVGYFWDTTKLPIDEKKYLFYVGK